MILASNIITLVRVNDGDTGNGVYSITEQYYVSTSKNTPTGGSWSTDTPTWSTGKYIWTRSEIVYTDGTIAHTAEYCDSTWEAVNEIEVGGRNLLLNSSFDSNFDKWEQVGTNEIVNEDGYECGHMMGELSTLKRVRQNVFNKLNLEDPNQEYTYSADIKLVDYVAGSTNPYVGLYFNGYYDNNGTTTWMGATTVSGFGNLVSYNNKGWVRASWTVKFTKIPTDMALDIYARDFTGDLYFKNVKFEKGNKATDWDPAPEDFTEAIDNVEDTANENAAQINNAQLDIDSLKATISTLVTGKNGETLMTQTDTGWVFNMTNILDTLDSFTSNIKFNMDNDGNPYIELGSTNSNFKLIITNTDIKFKDGSAVPASISNQALNIETAVINGELSQGSFAWVARSNGNYGLIWKG